MWRKHIRYINYYVVDYWVVICMLFWQLLKDLFKF